MEWKVIYNDGGSFGIIFVVGGKVVVVVIINYMVSLMVNRIFVFYY